MQCWRAWGMNPLGNSGPGGQDSSYGTYGHSLFVASPNLATLNQTWEPCAWCQRVWGMNPTGKYCSGGPDSSMKISGSFINITTLTPPPPKGQISVLIGMAPPYCCLPFEHSGTEMGSLDIESACSTLCPSITSTCSTSKFHFNMLQYSVWGAIILNAITYGQDCMWPPSSRWIKYYVITTTSELVSNHWVVLKELLSDPLSHLELWSMSLSQVLCVGEEL